MFSTTLSLNTNEAVFKLINKNFNHFLIHQFNPTYTSEFTKASIKSKGINLTDITVRKMSFDVLCDLKTIKEISLLNTKYLNIYQFNKPISDSLLIENLKPEIVDRVLKQNGLQHKYFLNHEFLSIYSFDEEYIHNIEQHPDWKSSILGANI
jgi:hypothetical protein